VHLNSPERSAYLNTFSSDNLKVLIPHIQPYYQDKKNYTYFKYNMLDLIDQNIEKLLFLLGIFNSQIKVQICIKESYKI
jgi:hypothetical protein